MLFTFGSKTSHLDNIASEVCSKTNSSMLIIPSIYRLILLYHICSQKSPLWSICVLWKLVWGAGAVQDEGWWKLKVTAGRKYFHGRPETMNATTEQNRNYHVLLIYFGHSTCWIAKRAQWAKGQKAMSHKAYTAKSAPFLVQLRGHHCRRHRPSVLR